MVKKLGLVCLALVLCVLPFIIKASHNYTTDSSYVTNIAMTAQEISSLEFERASNQNEFERLADDILSLYKSSLNDADLAPRFSLDRLIETTSEKKSQALSVKIVLGLKNKNIMRADELVAKYKKILKPMVKKRIGHIVSVKND